MPTCHAIITAAAAKFRHGIFDYSLHRRATQLAHIKEATPADFSPTVGLTLRRLDYIDMMMMRVVTGPRQPSFFYGQFNIETRQLLIRRF